MAPQGRGAQAPQLEQPITLHVHARAGADWDPFVAAASGNLPEHEPSRDPIDSDSSSSGHASSTTDASDPDEAEVVQPTAQAFLLNTCSGILHAACPQEHAIPRRTCKLLQRYWSVKCGAQLTLPDESYEILHDEPPAVLLCARPACQALLSAGAPDCDSDE